MLLHVDVGGSAAKVTTPGVPGVAVGVTVVSGGGLQHMNKLLRHPARNRNGTWNIVVVADGTGGGFAVAVADEQSGIARAVTDAAARATNER